MIEEESLLFISDTSTEFELVFDFELIWTWLGFALGVWELKVCGQDRA